MCVLYVDFWSKVRPSTCGYVAIGSAVLFILRSRLLLYYVGSGVNRVQVVLSGFSVSLLFRPCKKTVYRYGCVHFFVAFVLVCVDVKVMAYA